MKEYIPVKFMQCKYSKLYVYNYYLYTLQIHQVIFDFTNNKNIKTRLTEIYNTLKKKLCCRDGKSKYVILGNA